MSEALLHKIHSKGYWRILVRPIEYREKRIASLKECRDIVSSSLLSLRGWDYPHIDHKDFTNGQNYVSSGCDFMCHIEHWRLYQSGQFIHHFAMEEDWQSQVESIFGEKYNDIGFKGLEVISIVYRLSEILEFTSRLATKNIFNGGLDIHVQLHDTQDRRLFFWDKRRHLFQEYVCKIPQIEFKQRISEQELIGNGSEVALKLAYDIFERFNWNAPLEIFRNEQRELLRRLV
ncbi:hypothetical protein [Bacillus thuringiensis]|uniref:Uncharacterized protein n=1 Tax=Bacillus thuringiensis TaxID=1428 RepID=A0ABD6SS10_BACTU|nr:hypothetical protein [Bacillus thuringiensis]MCU5632905.1 hypothetical protein [Bacillus cereus]PEX44005.1 hypothetical protein CN461_27950 [Bacillus thuringiensis]PFN84548.1 hypothetical protein COJ76_21550 [Bacillus thuringiensis]PGO19965.1 hypothetical protein CN974_08540 [Bacillus thuringiensis]